MKNDVTTGDVSVAVESAALVKPNKVKLPIRLAAFVLTVITLSWFFEGWREIQREPGLVSFSYLFFGTTFTLLLLAVQGFWIYIEEKSTGKLVRKVKLFDAIEAKLAARNQNTKDRDQG
ncbi:MAG: hypothetical protein C0507_22275 [Cyanobacteria bacterium PR.3.49]|jgi:hypothetical protein|nr:hypothetical protein [Cyanobacteria bacterium PR.3.49]